MLRFTLDIGFLKRRFPTLKPTAVVKPAIAIGSRLFWKFIPIAVNAVPGFVAKSPKLISPAPLTSVVPFPLVPPGIPEVMARN